MTLQLHYWVFTPKYRCSEKKGHQYPNVYSSNGHSHQTVERTKMPFNWWMDKEDVAHIHYGVLCLHQKGWISSFCINMDGTEGDYAEWNKSSRESKLSYDFTYLYVMSSIMRRKGKVNWGKLEGKMKHEKLWNLRNKLRLLERRRDGGMREPGGGY